MPSVPFGRRRRAPSRGTKASFAMALALCAPFVSACPSQELAPLAPCTRVVGRASIQEVGTNQVDLLFVIDDSGSMKEEQSILAAQLENLVRVLTTGKFDPSEAESFRPVDLHLGVVSTNMGTPGLTLSGESVESCATKDGLLRPLPSAEGDANPTFLTFAPGQASGLSEVSRLVDLGIEGCGFEQQLEAGLKALTPRASDIEFAGGHGHGDDENRGFLREDSLVVVLTVSDEDDCSTDDTKRVFQTDGALETRCAFADNLYPVARYVRGLKALRPGRENMVLFAAITGVDPGLIEMPEQVDYDAVLAHSSMQNRPNEAMDSLVPSCSEEGVGVAYPPRRIVEVAKGFGENGIVQSICKNDYSGALEVVLRRISDLIGAACPPRALVRDGAGLVPCRLVETPPPGTACEGASRIALTGADEGRCELPQVAVRDGSPANAPGWFYDAENREGRCQGDKGAIAFTPGSEPAPGARIDLECTSVVTSQAADPRNEEALELPCASTDECMSHVDANRSDLTLFCDPASNRCQIACASDAECKAPMACDLSESAPRCVPTTCAE